MQVPTTTFTYDLGDLAKVKDPLNRETCHILDAAGRLRNITNPLGQQTVYTPDVLDRITQLTDAINWSTTYPWTGRNLLAGLATPASPPASPLIIFGFCRKMWGSKF